MEKQVLFTFNHSPYPFLTLKLYLIDRNYTRVKQKLRLRNHPSTTAA